MEKLHVPRIDGSLRKAMESRGIKINDKMTPVSVKKAIIKYMDEHTVIHLGTCSNNIPRVTPIEFRNKGLRIYLFSEGGVKINNIKKNPKVSASIANHYDRKSDYFSSRGIQLWGKAKVYGKDENRKIFLECIKLMGIKEKSLPPLYPYKIIVIEPEKIRYQDARNGYWFVTWEK
ncbi:MAG: pyridoxamine 5'-phosphate oxidase family protein [Candidatus Schekmanbacteria bacterium]|nr:pyridoxamine 5'-phosphate oxidase family protein [Candidatus Schekmanbacteria bacterium]